MKISNTSLTFSSYAVVPLDVLGLADKAHPGVVGGVAIDFGCPCGCGRKLTPYSLTLADAKKLGEALLAVVANAEARNASAGSN